MASSARWSRSISSSSFDDLLRSLGRGTRRIRDPIDLDHQTVNQHVRLKKGHQGVAVHLDKRGSKAVGGLWLERRGSRVKLEPLRAGEVAMRLATLILCAALTILLGLIPGHAEKRLALVIGNENYANLPAREQLQKAVNDGRAVGKALGQIGFDVIPGENLGRQAMVDKLDELTRRLSPGDKAFFFFSGHGVTLDGVNYILPADVPDVEAGQETRLKGAALAESYIISELLRRGVQVAVVVLDACRTNPFGRAGAKGVGGGKGLVPPPQVQGVFSLYAASSGQAARDRLYDGDRNPNSVFTRVLVPALTKPGLDLAALAIDVREEVVLLARSAGYDQRPSYYDETSGGRVYLAGLPTANPAGSAGVGPSGNLPAIPDRVPAAAGMVPLRPATTPMAAVAPPVAPAVPLSDPCGGPVTVSFPSRCAAPLTTAQERGLQPKDSFKECAQCPEMVVVPSGSFTMGSPESELGRDEILDKESPQHVVAIGKPFAVGRLHVTVDEFAAFVAETGYVAGSKCWTFEGGTSEERSGRSWRNPGFAQEGSHPAGCLNWYDAKAYVDWLTRKTHKPYRLLTEAEWEYAARARTTPGTYPRFWFGNDEKELCRYGNGGDQQARDTVEGTKGWGGWTAAPCNDGYAYTSPAGHFEANGFGLYDMFGNAQQWTADCYHDNYKGAPADGSAWTTEDCNRRVLRGGSWSFSPRYLRAATRIGSSADGRDDDYGLRVGRTLTP
jgi:formylglycine-generating enzyme required for sulfatase activity